jgi:hypothetical protein
LPSQQLLVCNNKSHNINYKNLYDNDFSLIIKYSRDIQSEALVNKSIEEIEKNHALTADRKNYYNQNLALIFPDVKNNDIIAAKYSKAGLVNFYYNNKFSGKISDKNFTKQFLDIWLGNKATYPTMRIGLLNGQ